MNPRVQYLIQNPFEAGIDDVSILQDELTRYPYFSSLRALLLFAMKEYEHPSYTDELKKTGIYSPSRVALYHYLQKERAEKPIVLENEVSDEISVTVEQPSVDEMTTDEVSTESVAETPADTENETTTTIDEAADGNESLNVDDTVNIPVEEKEINTDNETVSAQSEMTFSEWLSTTSVKTDETVEEPTEKDIKFKLIDEFLEKSPKIQAVDKSKKTDSETPVRNLSTEYSDLMTETLAQIYVNQKKYDKAIRAYKILSIKYPEKRTFFLELISEIEDLMGS